MRVLDQSMYVNQHLAASKRQKRGCYFFPPSALRNYNNFSILINFIKPRKKKKPHSPSQVESTLKWFKCLLRDREGIAMIGIGIGKA